MSNARGEARPRLALLPGALDAESIARFARAHSGPIYAALVGMATFAVLAVFVSADPPSGVTASVAPFTDESYNVVNARNFVLFGRFSFDQWNLYLANTPFTALMVGTFELFGVGFVQARLAMAACTAGTAALLAGALVRPLGRVPAAIGGLAFAFCGLTLFYGRLAFVEDLVALGLTAGVATLARPRPGLGLGIVAGLGFAVAAGTKPLALFAIGGLAAALAVYAWFCERGLFRWLLGSIAAVALAGLLWVMVIYLPHRAEVADVLAVWPRMTFPVGPRSVVHAVVTFVYHSDHVLGPLAAPLLALGLGASAVIVVRWRSLGIVARRLAVASWGWVVGGGGIVVVASYHPNRYLVPEMPALALLAAVGLHALLQWLDVAAEAREQAAVRSQIAATVAAAALGVAVIPGLLLYGHWFGHRTHEAVAMDSAFRSAVPAGARVAGGDAIVMLMQSHAVAIQTGVANNGNLYGQGVRYYVAGRSAPSPTGVPGPVWAARRTVGCALWRGATICLYRVT